MTNEEARVELVVKIDEKTYEDIKKGKVYNSYYDVPLESVLAIANGTPLPKGHGRLIDGDKVVEILNHQRFGISKMSWDIISEKLSELSSVTPQPKTGHWKRISMDKYSEHAKYWYRCDRCGKDNLGNTDWCPSCGAMMAESEEA